MGNCDNILNGVDPGLKYLLVIFIGDSSKRFSQCTHYSYLLLLVLKVYPYLLKI